jgi:hypothetical protein
LIGVSERSVKKEWYYRFWTNVLDSSAALSTDCTNTGVFLHHRQPKPINPKLYLPAPRTLQYLYDMLDSFGQDVSRSLINLGDTDYDGDTECK